MRYEDASGTFSAATGNPDARDDADVLPAGSHGPATGNTISGAGTISGVAGADLVTDGPGKIVALEGASGSDTSNGGNLHVGGRFGDLTMDTHGNYKYAPNVETPNGARDVFRYTLADNAGARDAATLTIEIGRDPQKIDASAQQIVPGPDGVVTLPPGVELSDVHVVGRNLVIDMPDGSQMVIVDGAIFVPQLVLNGVEVPATNLAALLIDSEPQPAAGIPQSSGGNFDVPVPPLDPGIPLGDLIPPTELGYTPPEFHDVGQFIDREPEILIQPDGQPASIAAVDSVNEAGLPARNEGEPAGSGEIGDGNGSNNSNPSEVTTGTILINSPDDPSVVTIDGVAVTGVGQVFAGAFGNLTITSISDTAIGYSYLLLDNTSGNTTHDDFSVTVTDNDGDQATATLVIDIIDDVPTARNDTDASANGVATGNVITDASPGDVGDSDTNAADTVGADDASLTSVTGFGGSADSTFSGGLLNVDGQFGTLAIDASGNYTYTVNPNAGGGGVDVFTYTLTDGDGDTSTATLTITNPDLFPHTGPNPVVRTDDDAVPLANGNPGGVGDDVDAENLTGTLSGSGGDGALTFDLVTTGAPAGFTYVDGPGGSVLVQQVQGGATVTVLTITVVPATGAYTVTQNAPIDHPAGSDENNVSFTIGYTVTDIDGDPASGSLTINVDDDTPTIGREDISAPTLTVDETDLTVNATGDFSTLFNVSYGADGPGTTSYGVSVVNGTDSGLVDVATGQSIFLFNNAGVVEGHVGNSSAGALAFTVSVNGSGVVTLDQVRALDHPDATNPDDAVSPDSGSIQLTVSAVDGDGDPVSQTINIGGNLVFEDDGPSVSNLQAGPGVTLDETAAVTPAGFPISANSAGPVITGMTSYGADGAGTTAYGLTVVGGGATLLKTAIGDFPITLVQTDAQTITGQYNNGGLQTAFTVHINADGTLTVTENVPLEHNVDGSTPAAYNDALDLSGLVNATITVTDRDGDAASGSVGIGGLITFLDDGPSINVTAGADANVLLQTQDADTIGAASDTAASSANFSGVFGLTFAGGADGAAGSPTVDTYTLGVSSSGVDSGLNQSGANIYLYVIGGKVVGSTSATIGTVNAGNTVFDVAVNGTGVVTLTQYSQIDHPLADDPTASGTPFADQLISMADNLVTLTGSSTVTDNDGDTATDSATINIGANLQFADDGPDISASLAQGAQLRIDETDGVGVGAEVDGPGGNLGTVTVSAASLFSVSNIHVSADSPTTLSYGLTLASQGVASGLLLSTTNAPIFLYNVGGVVYGSTSATVGGVSVANTVFTATIDSGTGAVTLTQFFAVEHTDTTSYNELSSAIAAGALNVTITATDSDGDTDTASVDLGSVTQFLDDGPTIDVTTNADAGILLQTQDGDTIGAATDTSSASFAGAFGLTSSGGSDGAATTPALSYALGVSSPGADSGLDQAGANIYLYSIGGKVVGSTSATLAGVNAGNTVFDVSVVASGVNAGTVTLTQYSQIDHPLQAGANDAPFVDQIISMTDSLVTLTATSTITDNDGDTATDSATIGIGANLQFADDGPIATNDTDSIVGGNGPATGNVITGVDIVGGDANSTDGNLDSIGADTPGTITRIASNNVPANVDTSYDGSGNLVVVGQYGTLTINADGSYSYLRTTATGGVSDVFTYTLTDRDGDTATATLTIGIEDKFPVGGNVNVQLDDDALSGGNPGGIGDDVDPVNASGTLPSSGGDGTLTFSVQTTGAPAGFTYVSGGAGIVLVQQGGTTVLTVTVGANGSYSVVQNAPINHPAGADENNVAFTVNYTVTDADGDSAPGTISINVDDDTPTVSANLAVQLDDDALAGGNAGGIGDDANATNTTGTLAHSYGADGAGSVAYLSTGAPAGFSYALQGNGDLWVMQGATHVLTLTVNVTTGAYSVTQVAPIDHPAGLDENNVSFTISYSVTDHDGDSATGSIVVNVDDDTPTVSANAAVQLDDDALAGGNAGGIGDANPDTANTVGTLAHSYGADGAGSTAYLTTGAPAGFTYQLQGNGDLWVLQGATHVITLTVNATTGAYAVIQVAPISHPAGGDENDVAFTISYQVTDHDGDTATGSIVVNVDDDTPTAQINLVAGQNVSIDESIGVQSDSNDTTNAGVIALFAGVATPGTDTDLPQYATNANAIVTSAGSAVGADTPGTTVFSLNVLAAGVDSGLNTTDGHDILLYQEGNLIVGRVSGGADAGKAAFAIAIDSTGHISTVEYLSIQHPDATNPDDMVSIINGAVTATVTVMDADGDSVSSTPVGIGSHIQFQDSAPVLTAVDNINIQNSGDVAATGGFHYLLGADGALPTNDVLAVSGSATVNGAPVTNYVINETSENATSAVYTFSFDYANGSGTTAHETGTLTFDKAAGTYTVDLDNPIAGFSVLGTAGAPAGNFVNYNPDGTTSQGPAAIATVGLSSNLFIQFTGDSAGTHTTVAPDGTFVPTTGTFAGLELFTGTAANVTLSSSAAGVAGNTIQAGEVLDFNLYNTNPLGTTGGVPTGSATSMFIELDGVGSSEDMIVVLKLYDTVTGLYTTKAVIVENGDIITNNATLTGTAYAGIVLDNNDGLIVIEPNDYQAGNTNLVIVGAQISASDSGITGTGISFNGALGATGGSSGTQPFSTDVGDGPFKIQNIGFLTTTTTNQNADLTFNVTVRDGDNDTVAQTIHATVTAAADSATPIALAPAVTTVTQIPLATKTASTTDSHLTVQQPANTNNVLIGALAAAGIEASTAAAAHDSGPSGHQAVFADTSVAATNGSVQGSSAHSADSARPVFSGETREAAEAQLQGGSSAHHGQEAASNALTVGEGQASQSAAPLLEGTEASAQSAPAQSSFTSGGVGMPSAAMLAAANANDNALEGTAKGTAAVQHVLIDALAGGGHGPNIDAVIDAVANQAHGGGQAAIEALASHGPAAVPGWDMSAFAGFTGAHAAFTAEHMALHMDAAPAAA